MPNKENDKNTNEYGNENKPIDEITRENSSIDSDETISAPEQATKLPDTMQGYIISSMNKEAEEKKVSEESSDEPLEESKVQDEAVENTDIDLPENIETEEEKEIVTEQKGEIAPINVPKPPKTKRKNGGPNKTVLRILIICLIILGSLAGLYLFSFLQNEKYLAAIDTENYYEGIYVDNIHIGGLNRQQAEQKIRAQQQQKENEIKVIVKWDETEEYPFYSSDVNIEYDTDEILSEAHSIARYGTNKERYQKVMDLQVNNVHLTTTRSIDASPIETMVREIATSKATEVSEPAVEFYPDKNTPREDWFVYSDPIPGIETDDEALWQSVRREFEDETFGTVPVPKWEILPDEDIDFREITQQIVSFKTKQARNSNREHNIALACSMINGTILMPGEEFSMNDTTGERTKAAGFKEANTIMGGNELVPGIAGGVCQVSGTLFNAALIADLEITERYHHSFELGYLKRGRDATVSYGYIDLKFKNNKEYPIYIAMFTDGLDVYAEIYGAPLTNCDHVTIWVKTTKTIPIGDPIYVKDSTVPAGSEPKLLKGHQGITCEVYKIYKDAEGNTISSEKAYTDVYKYYAPELHVNPADYERYTNPTPVPTATPDTTPANAETPEPDSTPVSNDDDGDGSVG